MSPSETLSFKMQAGVVWVFTVTGVMALSVIFGVAVMVAREPNISNAIFGIIMLIAFGGGALYSWDAIQRARSVIMVDSDGIRSVSKRGPSTSIAWTDVGSVRSDDTMQRLIVISRDRTRRIWAEYQLNRFDKLREYVSSHTRAVIEAQAAKLHVFHRSPINRVIFSGFSLVSVVMTVVTLQLPWFATIIGLNAVFFAIAACVDPAKLVFETNGFVLASLLTRRHVAFDAVADIALANEADGRGNDWQVVIVRMRTGKPLKLYRFREGSLALFEALTRARQRAEENGSRTCTAI